LTAAASFTLYILSTILVLGLLKTPRGCCRIECEGSRYSYGSSKLNLFTLPISLPIAADRMAKRQRNRSIGQPTVINAAVIFIPSGDSPTEFPVPK